MRAGQEAEEGWEWEAGGRRGGGGGGGSGNLLAAASPVQGREGRRHGKI